MGVGAAFAVASFGYGVFSGSRSKRKIREAQRKERRIQEFIRREQAVRERNKQIRTANILTSQTEARQFATEGGGLASSALTGVRAGVAANLSRNIGDISTSLAQGSALTAAQEGVSAAGRPSTFDIFAQQAQPLIFGNIDRLDQFFETAFSSDTGTP